MVRLAFRLDLGYVISLGFDKSLFRFQELALQIRDPPAIDSRSAEQRLGFPLCLMCLTAFVFELRDALLQFPVFTDECAKRFQVIADLGRRLLVSILALLQCRLIC